MFHTPRTTSFVEQELRPGGAMQLKRFVKSSLDSKVLDGGFIGVFPKIGVPQNGWFIMENLLLKWMFWGYHHFSETSIDV